MPISPLRIDVADMRRRLGEDDELIAAVIGIFLDDYPDRLRAIDAAAGAHDLEALRREAHTLKGSASNLSAVEVVEAAAALEESAASGGPAAVVSQVAILSVATEQLAIALRAFTAGRS